MKPYFLGSLKDGSKIYIRRAAFYDLHTLTSLSKKCFSNDVKKYGEGPKLHDSGLHMLDNITNHHTFVILRKKNDVIKKIGGVVVRKKDKICHLSLIFFLPKFQRFGLGIKVMNYLIKEEFKGCTKWEAWTVKENFVTKQFYERLGFKKVKEEKPGKVLLSFYELFITPYV